MTRFVRLSGNARTYTSYKPDSADVYANQRPSGENAAVAAPEGKSTNSSEFPASGSVPLFRTAAVLKDHFPSAARSEKANVCPSGVNDSGARVPCFPAAIRTLGR